MASLDGIQLPDDLNWSDEFTAWRVGQVVRTSLTGALIIQEAALQAGRPITLESTSLGNGQFVAPVTLDVLQALRAKEEIAGGAPMTLTLPATGGGTRSMSVRWRRTDGPAIEAQPIRFIVPAEPGDYFLITLRLLQV